MSYDRQISTDYATFLNDLHSKLSGMPSWGVVNDSSATGHVAFSGPQGVTHVLESNLLGDGSEANDSYLFVPVESYTDASTYTEYQYEGGRVKLDINNLSANDSVQYWLQYTDTHGYVVYVRRDVGDGSDWSFWHGGVNYADDGGTYMWDVDSSDAHSQVGASYAWAGNTNSPDSAFNSAETPYADASSAASIPRGSSNDAHGKFEGVLNPDSAFNNYVWFGNIVLNALDVTDPDTGEQPAFAVVDNPLWLDDRSGSDVNTGDVVQDSGANDEWEIVDYYSNRVAIRMI